MTTPSFNPADLLAAIIRFATPAFIANLHKQSDVDSSPTAQHHRLGILSNQAAPGNHTHDGRNSALLTIPGELLGNGSVSIFQVTATTTRIKVTCSVECTAAQSGSLTVTVTGHNSTVMNDNIMTVGANGTSAGRPQSASNVKFFNCDVGDVITITPGGFSGTLNRIEIYVESST